MMRRITLLFAFTFCVLFSYGQDIFISPLPGNNTVCPGSAFTYSLATGPGVSTSDCGYSWTVTHGEFHAGGTTISGVSSVDVIWDNAPEVGVLTLTLANCDNNGYA